MAEKQASAKTKLKPNSGSSPQWIIDSLTTDEQLAWQCQQGCQLSFAELVRRYNARLFQFLQPRTGSIHDTEDLVQDTFIKAYQNIHRYHSNYRFSTWLFTIAARLAISRYRSSNKVHKIDKTAPATAEPAEILLKQQDKQNLWALARKLPQNQYQVLWLRYAGNMSVKEIAKTMKKSQVNIRVLLYRARSNLAKLLLKATSQSKEKLLSIKSTPMKDEGN